MRYTFSPDDTEGVQCSADFSFHADPVFQNRSFCFYKNSFLFDGYSHWFRANSLLPGKTEYLTLTVSFLPLTYSAHGDGLFSCRADGQGLAVLLEKGGNIAVQFGRHRFCSIRSNAQAGKWNMVTVIYRGDAGWCDLYVNGILSARKQFPRHTKLVFPDAPAYLGRLCGERQYREELPFGCFYGFMEFAELDFCAKAEEEIRSLHKESIAAQQPDIFALGMPRRSDYKNDRSRPCYHLSPEGKWMNEPHAPFFYGGWYHIFYQGNPHAPIWDHLCWGHLKSRDLVHWQSCPLALIPEKEPTAPDGCWSGSAVIDKDGTPRLYFTAGDNSRFPNQAVALAMPEDADLDSWKSLPHLIQEQDMGWMGEFRDPFVWLENGTYFMLVGSGDAHNGGGNAILYSSDDGLQWQNHGFLVDYDFEQNAEVGHVWELPVLLPLRDETGTVACHMLLLCACQIENETVETYYFLGNWDAKARKFTKYHEKAMLLDLGKGVFTGPSGFVTPDGRSLLFTIAQGRRSFPDEVHSGWAHNGGLPVELSIRDGQVQILPIRELEGLRTEQLSVSCPEDLCHYVGDELCLDYIAQGDCAAVQLHYGEKLLEVYYDRTTKHLGVRNEAGEEIGRWRCSEDDVDIGNEPIHFLCYLDRSMLEIYLNGRKAVSLRNYTDGSRYFTVSGTPKQLLLWRMACAYEEE